MARLERRITSLMETLRSEEPQTALLTDFYCYNTFPVWPGGECIGGSMSLPGSCAIRLGDRAILFCLVDRKSHRDMLEELSLRLKEKGCDYFIALL